MHTYLNQDKIFVILLKKYKLSFATFFMAFSLNIKFCRLGGLPSTLEYNLF